MYCIFTYIWPKFMINVGKLAIHWAFGYIGDGHPTFNRNSLQCEYKLSRWWTRCGKRPPACWSHLKEIYWDTQQIAHFLQGRRISGGWLLRVPSGPPSQEASTAIFPTTVHPGKFIWTCASFKKEKPLGITCWSFQVYIPEIKWLDSESGP